MNTDRRAGMKWWLPGALAALACAPGGPTLEREAILASTGGTNPTATVDSASGTVFVAWVGQDDSVTANVYLARSTGESFSQPVRVNDRRGDAAPHLQAPAQVTLGPDGMLYVAWQSTRPVQGLMFGAADIRLARSADGGRSFEPAVSVNDDAGRIQARHTFHDIAVGRDGTVYVSWIDARHRDSARVEAAKTKPRAHVHQTTTGGMAGAEDEPTTDIRVARSTDQGRTFTAGVVVDTNSCTCCRTAITAAPDGSLYVAWRKLHPGDVNDIVVSRSADRGETWSAPVKVHDDGWVFPGCPHAGPDLHVDQDNVLHAVWYTGAPGKDGLFYAISTDAAQTFGTPTALVSGGVPVSQARLAAAGPGSVWIGWEDRRSEPLTVGLAWASNAGQFRRFDQSFPGTAPALAAAGSTLALAWLEDETVKVRTGG